MKKRILRLGAFLAGTVMVCGVLLGRFTNSRTCMYAEVVAETFPVSETTASGRVTRILLLGVDRTAKLTDSMMILTLDESAQSMRILQIPRDTYARYTDGDYKKLNGALKLLGESGTRQWFSNAFGVPIHYFAIIDLSLLRDLVDAVGGVDLVSPQEMRYSDPEQDLEIRLPKGPVHLDGAAAEQFVRYRSGYPDADLGRLDAQKLFLRAFLQKCGSLSGDQLFRLVCTSLTRLQTDIDLTAAIRLCRQFRQIDPTELPMATIAGQAEQGSSGAWYYVLNREGACKSINAYLLPESPIQTKNFDPSGLFDRPDYEKFHKIYIASESDLPLVETPK